VTTAGLTPLVGRVPSPQRVRARTVVAASIRRDWTIARSYRLPFALGLFQSLVSLAFVDFLGRLVGPHPGREQLPGGYFAFAVLGTVLLATFGVTLTSFAQRLRAEQTSGTLEVLLTMPAPARVAVLASGSYQLLASAVAAAGTVGLAVGLFGLRFHVTVQSALAAVAGTGAALVVFAATGLALAAFVVVFKRGETLTSMASSALMVLGGVYYPVSVLPAPLRHVASVVPFTWALDVVRASLLAGRVPLGQLAVLAVAGALALPGAMWLLGRAVDRARRTGTLGQY